MSFFMFYGKYEVIKVLDYGWSDDQKYLIQETPIDLTHN